MPWVRGFLTCAGDGVSGKVGWAPGGEKGSGDGKGRFCGVRVLEACGGGDVLLSRGSFRAGRKSLRSSAGVHLAWPAWLQKVGRKGRKLGIGVEGCCFELL